MKTLKTTIFAIALCSSLFSCVKDKDNKIEPQDDNSSKYVIITSSSDALRSGYITSHGSTIPTGLISNVKSNSKQTLSAFGFRTFGRNLYKFRNFSGERGLQKFTVDNNGSIQDLGFIACGNTINGSGQHLIISETEGYYFDGDIGLLKIQKFNPSTMQRTGELDFSKEVGNAAQEFVSLGQNIMMNKAGKLYANVNYGKSKSKGYLDAADDTIRFAVIDIATGKYEKTIKYTTGNPQQIGWVLDNAMWEADDDGSLYFCAMGKVAGGNSQILRIKANETEIDTNWQIKMDDITKDGCFHNVLAKNGKIYTRIPSEGILPDFSNLSKDIWQYYVIDIATKSAQKITGIPSVFFNGNANAIVDIDNTIYIMVTNNSQNVNGFYKVDGTSASQLFNVNEGGEVIGFAKIK